MDSSYKRQERTQGCRRSSRVPGCSQLLLASNIRKLDDLQWDLSNSDAVIYLREYVSSNASAPLRAKVIELLLQASPTSTSILLAHNFSTCDFARPSFFH
jgi:hypothetical protein